MIYSFNAKDNVMYSVIKSSFGLSDEAVYKTIQDEFSVLLKRLSCKKVPYEKLKGALVPNQEANMYETCLVVDWMQIDDCNYGGLVFNALLPLLDKDSTCSILCGDYIDNLNTGPGGKFCVSVFRQNQEYHVINVHDGAYSPWLQLSRKVGAVCAPCTA